MSLTRATPLLAFLVAGCGGSVTTGADGGGRDWTSLSDVELECTGMRSVTVGIADLVPGVGVVGARIETTPLVFPATLPVGQTRITWDLEGGGSALQYVRVVDTMPPLLDAPAPSRTEASHPEGTEVAILPPLANDLCGGVMIENDAPRLFTLGTTRVHVSAVDGAGLRTSTAYDVEVVDTTAPVFPELPSLSIEHDGTQCFVPFFDVPDVSDNGYPAFRLAAVITARTGPGTAPCWEPGAHVITWEASDPAGNRRMAMQDVTVTRRPFAARWEGFGRPNTSWFPGPSVDAVISVSGGRLPYSAMVDPFPDELIVETSRVVARYTRADVRNTVRAEVRDATGARIMVEGEGFGLDPSPPTIRAPRAESEPARVRWELDLSGWTAFDGGFLLPALAGPVMGFDRAQVVTALLRSVPSGADPISISAWVQTSTGGGDLVRRGALRLFLTATGTVGFEVPAGRALVSVAGRRIADGRWHHVAGSYDGTHARLWVDGRLAAGGPATTPIEVTLGALVIGGGFRGQLAQVRIERAAIDRAEALARWAGGEGAAWTRGPAELAAFDFGGTGQTVPDLSGNGSDGVLGTSTAQEPLDPVRQVVPLERLARPPESGLVSFALDLVRPDGTTGSIFAWSAPPSAVPGSMLPAGLAAKATEGLTLDTSLLPLGLYRVLARAEDAAGNTTSVSYPFQTPSFQITSTVAAAYEAAAEVEATCGGSDALEDAAVTFECGSQPDAFFWMGVARAARVLAESARVGCTTSSAGAGLAGRLIGEASRRAAILGPLSAADQLVADEAAVLIAAARASYLAGDPLAAASSAARAIAALEVLDPSLLGARRALEALDARWVSGLGMFSGGMLDRATLASDPTREALGVALAREIRSMVFDLDGELARVLARPCIPLDAPLRARMTELRDILIKESGAVDERADLFAMPGAPDGCLDVVTSTAPPFCFLRLGDALRFADEDEHPRVRAALELAVLGRTNLLLQDLAFDAAPPEVVVSIPFSVRFPGTVSASTIPAASPSLAPAFNAADDVSSRLSRGDTFGAWSFTSQLVCHDGALVSHYYGPQPPPMTLCQ